jgi:hypothetical protein
MPLKIKLPWQKEHQPPKAEEPVDPEKCTHPRLDVEMHGPVVKRRWCTVCGKDLTDTLGR